MRRLSLIALLIVALCGCSSPVHTRTVAPSVLSTEAGSGLTDEKARQEIIKLEEDNSAQDSWRRQLLDQLPAVTVLVAILTFATSWSRQRRDAARQRTLDRQDRLKEVQQSIDVEFSTTVTNLASSSESLQAGAAALLPIYLRDRNLSYCELVYAVIVANLRVGTSPAVHYFLVGGLESSIRRLLELSAEAGSVFAVDLSQLDCHGVNLSNSNFRPGGIRAKEADLSDGEFMNADLWKLSAPGLCAERGSFQQANLGQASLAQGKFFMANFNGARMTSANLRQADVRHALFRGASLQSAHFDGADLRGARFEGAKLSDTYFIGAQLDAGTIASFSTCLDWNRAHFDPAVLATIQTLAATNP